MHIDHNIDVIIELHNESNIQNQDINDFWVNDDHYMKKTTIKGIEYYEWAFDVYYNSPIAVNLQ